VPFFARFVWMKNSANETKHLWLETTPYKGLIDYVDIYSKADAYYFYREISKQRKIKLVICCCERMNKIGKRRQMITDIH
jgi:hypothetical protein